MKVIRATQADFETVKTITIETISVVYPHYYPSGAVQYFLEYHSDQCIADDIAAKIVYLCLNAEGKAVGTVSVRGNEITRLFVLPAYHGNGYGRALLDFAEALIFTQYPEIILSASFPAKQIYLNRGYHTIGCHTIKAANGDFLCYDEMVKNRTK